MMASDGWRAKYRSKPFKPLGYHGPLIVPTFGWRSWASGAVDAYRGCRKSMDRRQSLVWVWRARP